MKLLKNRTVLLTLLLVGFLAFGSGVLVGSKCQTTHKGHWKQKDVSGHERQITYFIKALKLSSEQDIAFRAIMAQHAVALKQERHHLKGRYDALKAQKISEINGILTPEQQITFKQLMEKHEKGKKGKKGYDGSKHGAKH
jgi:Spy/CpxP family protein refolding chaperone